MLVICLFVCSAILLDVNIVQEKRYCGINRQQSPVPLQPRNQWEQHHATNIKQACHHCQETSVRLPHELQTLVKINFDKMTRHKK